MAELTSYIPSFSLSMPSTDLIGFAVLALLFGVFLVILWQLSKHRIWVDIYEQVKEGTVSTGGRYRRTFDRETKMYYLRPLQMSSRLPDFDNENYQKVDGFPIIGITRQIKLIKVNNWSYYTVTPDHNTQDTCIAKYKDSISWIHSELMRDFKTKINKARLYQMIIILTPVFVFIICFLFLFIALFTDLTLIKAFEHKLDVFMEVMKK